MLGKFFRRIRLCTVPFVLPWKILGNGEHWEWKQRFRFRRCEELTVWINILLPNLIFFWNGVVSVIPITPCIYASLMVFLCSSYLDKTNNIYIFHTASFLHLLKLNFIFIPRTRDCPEFSKAIRIRREHITQECIKIDLNLLQKVLLWATLLQIWKELPNLRLSQLLSLPTSYSS